MFSVVWKSECFSARPRKNLTSKKMDWIWIDVFFRIQKNRIPNSCIWTTDPGGGQRLISPKTEKLLSTGKFPGHKKRLKLTFAHHENSHSSRWGFISQLFCDSLCDDLLLWTKVNSLTLCWCFARVVASHESMNSWSAFFWGDSAKVYSLTKSSRGQSYPTWLCNIMKPRATNAPASRHEWCKLSNRCNWYNWQTGL